MATAIDRNVWQYLVDATGGAYDPALDASDVREERVAALRIVLHTPSILCVTPSVHAEFERIGDPGRWRENAGMRDVFIREVQPRDLDSGLWKRARACCRRTMPIPMTVARSPKPRPRAYGGSSRSTHTSCST